MKDHKGNYWWKKGPARSLALLILVFVFGYWLRGGGAAPDTEAVSQTSALEAGDAEERLLYVCPMMCVPPMEKPGACPICGMDLVRTPAGEDPGGRGRPTLRLSTEAMELAEIQVAAVERKFVTADVRLFGRIDYDPAHMSYITAFMPGLIDRVYVKRAGQFVRWGDPLFDIYSSDLLSTQEQLIEALKFVPGFMDFQKGSPHVAREVPVYTARPERESDGRSPEEEAALQTISAIRRKLRLLGLPKRDIDELMKVGEATGLMTVYAPLYGQVIEQKAFEGTYVNTGTPIFNIGDPRYVWAILDAYETDYPWLRRGQEVSFQTDAYPGETFKGELIYVDPVFKSKTRTFDVGVIFSDRGGRMKAGMLVRAVVHARLTAEGRIVNEDSKSEDAPLVIPASAPLITGKRAVVYVAVQGKKGVFEGREVVLGPKAKDHYVILGGLEEGDLVVVNGNFKIDSAVQILAKPSMMDIPGGYSATAHQHHGGSEVMEEDYLSKRRQSRLGGGLDQEAPPRPALDSGDRRPRRHPSEGGRDRATISRRRPGVYGDTTRSGSSLLER